MSQPTPANVPPSEQESKQPSAQEVLEKLRDAHVEKAKTLSDLKEQYLKLQEQILSAQEAAFKSYQNFVMASEQNMINIINAQNEQLKALQAAKGSAKPSLPTIPEARSDNVATA